MSGTQLFTPKTAGTVSIAATTTTANVALVALGSHSVRVVNADTTNIAFVNFGTSSVTAVAGTGTPIRPNSEAGFSIGEGVTHAAAITGSSTATVYFTPGNGV